MKVLKAIGYYLVSYTWGIIMTAIGTLVALILLLTGHRPYRFHYAIYFRIGHHWGGVELGPFFLIDQEAGLSTQQHEHGHGLQNLWWGPLMPFVICIPSAVRYWYREIIYAKKKKQLLNNKITIAEYQTWLLSMPGYDDIWFEGQATRLGKKYFK